MTRRMIGAALAASLALTTTAAMPAQAHHDDLGKVVLGAATLLIIGSALSSGSKRPSYSHSHSHHRHVHTVHCRRHHSVGHEHGCRRHLIGPHGTRVFMSGGCPYRTHHAH